MSVVAYKDGVMAADTRAYSGNGHPIGEKMKIHRLKDGSLLGIVSNQVGIPETFKGWIERGAKEEDYIQSSICFTALHVMPDGRVYLFDDGFIASGPLEGKEFTIGSGRKYALGALHAGAALYNAVKAAIDLDLYTGGRVRMLGLNNPDLDI